MESFTLLASRPAVHVGFFSVVVELLVLDFCDPRFGRVFSLLLWVTFSFKNPSSCGNGFGAFVF